MTVCRRINYIIINLALPFSVGRTNNLTRQLRHTQGKDGGQVQPRRLSSVHFHHPEIDSELKYISGVDDKRHVKSWMMKWHLVDSKIVSNCSPLFIAEPNRRTQMYFRINKHKNRKKLIRTYFLALVSQTQQWTPRRPLYTHSMWLKPKSSANNNYN